MSGRIPKYGFSVDANVLTAGTTPRQFELDQIKAVGGGIVRIACSSAANFTNVDTFVNDALARGLDVMLCLWGTHTSDITPGSIGTFAHDAAVRYLGKVTYFELANEPDINGWTANGYADFVAAASVNLKSGNPDAVVIAGALWKGGGLGSATDPQHMVLALCTRAAGKFDIISLHMYDTATVRAIWNIWDWGLYWGGAGVCDNGANGGNVRQIMDANGAAGIPIIATEAGGSLLQSNLVTVQYTTTEQATITTEALKQVQLGKIHSCSFYEMKQHSPMQYAFLDGTDTPRPAYSAFNAGKKPYKSKTVI